MSQLTDNFHSDEFACHSGEDTPPEIIPVLRSLARSLQVIRCAWQAPIIIVSGWRSKGWNKRVGGAAMSRHLTGEAADIRPVHLGGLPTLAALVDRLVADGKLSQVGGLGLYPKRWLHLDIRSRLDGGRLARWSGRGVGSEQTA